MTIRFQTGEFSFIAFSSEMCARYALLNDMRFTCCYSFSLSLKKTNILRSRTRQGYMATHGNQTSESKMDNSIHESSELTE